MSIGFFFVTACLEVMSDLGTKLIRYKDQVFGSEKVMSAYNPMLRKKGYKDLSIDIYKSSRDTVENRAAFTSWRCFLFW